MKKLISLLFVMALTAAFMVSGAYASGAAVTVAVSGDAVVDGTITASFDLAGNPGFTAGSLAVSYDNTKLELVSLTKGLFQGDANKDTGIVNHASVDAVTGDGALCTATFKVLAEGTSSISAAVSGMRDDDGNPFDVAVTAAAVTVPGGSAPTVCEHDFSVENKDAVGALKTAGNCQTEAVYYKSCSKCGAVSTSDADTFTGDKAENVHTGSVGTAWVTDTANTRHWKEYSCCDAHADEAAHSSTGANVATCQHAAICDDCGKSYGSVAEHSYTAEVTKAEALKSAATCTEAAVYYKSCAGCGAVSTSESDVFTSGTALDHDWTEWTETTAPTCTEKGEETRTCKRGCGVTPETRDVAATGHGDWEDDYKVTTEATCGKDGVAEGTCGYCGTKITNIVLPATGDHAWDEGKVTKEATTTAAGEKTYTCTVCGQTKTESIAKLQPSGGQPSRRAPKTGDESHLVLWGIGLLAACGGTAVVIRKKKEN